MARLPPSRPIATAIEAVITAEEGLLLTFAYSGGACQNEFLNAFLKFLATQYGPSIFSHSLRHAMIALSAILLPEGQFRQTAVDYKRKAWQMLSKKLENQSIPTETDVLTTFLLVGVEQIYNYEDFVLLENLRKCKTMLARLLGQKKCLPLTLAFVSDFINIQFTFLGIPKTQVLDWHILSPGEVEEKFQYYNEFRRFESMPLPAFVVSIHESLADLVLQAILCVHISAGEKSIDNSNLSNGTDSYRLIQIQDQLRFCELRLENEGGLGDEIKDEILKTQLTTLLEQHIDTIQLIISLLEAPSILDGLNTAHTMSIASKLITSLQTSSPRKLPLSEYLSHPLYGAQIVLSGMALNLQDVTQGNF
jgi:hypothetical protein